MLRMAYSLHVEDLFVDFAKKQQRIVVEIKGFILCPHPTNHIFPVAANKIGPVVRPSLILVYILDTVELVLVLNIHRIFVPRPQKTINHSICIGYHN
jgi:hypothetical protein